jgi:rare lipoprotein A
MRAEHYDLARFLQHVLIVADVTQVAAAMINLVPRLRFFAHIAVLALLFPCFASGAEEKRARPRKTPRAEADGGNPPLYEVFGKRYRVRDSSAGYSERGIASWYGHPFHGRPTSSGERYDMNEMTAAHTSLPLPTWVEVTNLTNGKRIVVKVNDRGPFVGKRVIDLSYAAATALDIVGPGTARVEVRALDGPPREATAERRDGRRQPSVSPDERAGAVTSAAPPPTPAKPADSRPPASSRSRVGTPPADQSERLFAQAGKFTRRADAVRLVNELRAQGFVNAFVVTEDGRRKSSHRVRVGPLADDAAVERMSDELRELGAKRSRSVVMR